MRPRPRPEKSRRRRILTVLGIVALVSLIVSLASRETSPVGHWRSSTAHDQFASHYAAAFRDLPSPAATLDVRTGFGVVRVYRFEGSPTGRAPVVLLPGRSSASPVWADNLPSLLRLADVYAIDLLGEPGLSVQETPIENDEDQATWLAETLAALPEPGFHVMGMSIGGWTAVNLALRDPDKVLSIALLDPVMVFADLAPEVVVRSIPISVPWAPRSWRDEFSSWVAGGATVEDVPVADMIDAGTVGYALKLPPPTRISETGLSTITVPVLALLAGQSAMHDSAAAAETARTTLTCGNVEVYSDASHALNGEYPGEIARDLQRFVDSQATTPGCAERP